LSETVDAEAHENALTKRQKAGVLGWLASVHHSASIGSRPFHPLRQNDPNSLTRA
jgi:hypothetical protein